MIAVTAVLIPSIAVSTPTDYDVETITKSETIEYDNHELLGYPYMERHTGNGTITITSTSVALDGVTLQDYRMGWMFVSDAFWLHSTGSAIELYGYPSYTWSSTDTLTITIVNGTASTTIDSTAYTFRMDSWYTYSSTPTDYCITSSLGRGYAFLNGSSIYGGIGVNDTFVCGISDGTAYTITKSSGARNDGTLTNPGFNVSANDDTTNLGYGLVQFTQGWFTIVDGTEYAVTSDLVISSKVSAPATITHTQTRGWFFDDYKIIENVQSADGALELVTIDSIPFVHAKAVGIGNVTYTDGSTSTVTVQKCPLDLIVALGQSNNAYYGYDRYNATAPSIGTSYYFGSIFAPTMGEGSTTGSMLPISNYPNAAIIGDKAPAFCAAYYNACGHKAYYVIGATGGTSISTWQPDGTSWNTAKTIVANAVAAVDTSLYDLRYTGYTWIQGEADQSSMTSAQYVDYYTALNAALLNRELGVPLDHGFISLLAAEFTTANTALNDVADGLTTVTIAASAETFTTANGLMSSDGVHYSQTGDNLIGRNLGASMAAYYHPTSPTVDQTTKSIIAIVPLIFLVAIVLGAIAMFIRARD